MESSGPPRRGGFSLWLVLATLLLCVGTPLVYLRLRKDVRARNERAVSAALKTLAAAEMSLRAYDHDRNRILDFWTGDVRGLYYLVPTGDTQPMRLIQQEIADADPSHPGARPYRGYWFVAMDKDENGEDYRDAGGRNPAKFAFCAYPAEYGASGVRTFIINENNSMFGEDSKGLPRLQLHLDPPFKGKLD